MNRQLMVLAVALVFSCGGASGADGGSAGGSAAGGSAAGGSAAGGSAAGGSAAGGSAAGGSAAGGSAAGGSAAGGSAAGGSAAGGSAAGGSAAGGSASCSSAGGSAVDFIGATVFGQASLITKTGSNTVTAGPSVVQDVVGVSGLQVSPLLSLALTTTFADAGIRCNLNVLGTPPGGALLSLSSLLPDGGSDCVNAYTQVATDAGEKYVGTFSGNLRLLSGGDGGVYPLTCGSFSVTR